MLRIEEHADPLEAIQQLGPSVVMVTRDDVLQHDSRIERIAERFPQVSIVAPRSLDFELARRAAGRVRALVDPNDAAGLQRLVDEVRSERDRLDQLEPNAHRRFWRYYANGCAAMSRMLSNGVDVMQLEADRIEVGDEVRRITHPLRVLVTELAKHAMEIQGTATV